MLDLDVFQKNAISPRVIVKPSSWAASIRSPLPPGGVPQSAFDGFRPGCRPVPHFGRPGKDGQR
jgi:hypothetical protein